MNHNEYNLIFELQFARTASDTLVVHSPRVFNENQDIEPPDEANGSPIAVGHLVDSLKIGTLAGRYVCLTG